ncbi:MAG: carboxymuconolactone decarboxylase family protein, partial [Planctomycetota bacterium]
MPRLNPVTSPSAEQQQIFDNVKAGLGLVPNMVSTMAQSPHVAKAYLGFAGTLGGGSLSAALGEQIA